MATTMYLIENNVIVDKADFENESDGTEQGYITLSQATEPDVNWERSDESSDFETWKIFDDFRAEAYPSVGDQLDMMYHDLVNGTTTWRDAIAQVKTDIPKT